MSSFRCARCLDPNVRDIHHNPDSDAAGLEGYCPTCQSYVLILMEQNADVQHD